MRFRSELLWLLLLTASALIQPLAWEPPYATGVALKSKERKREREREKKERRELESNFGWRSGGRGGRERVEDWGRRRVGV